MSYRTQWCGEVIETMAGSRVQLAGWVHRRRDLGNLVFIDLRDRTGLLQLVFDPTRQVAAHAASHSLRNEFVITVMGTVVMRDQERINPNLATGHVEVIVDELTILAEAKPLPFLPDDHDEVDEAIRLKYRYIDLRRSRMHENLRLRDRTVQAVRRHLESEGFIEVETPILTKSTPEGARDFLVPSRLQPGRFYALPQSPQLFKQLLMIAGYERYYQIARAFRDEDLRADRQPEHTQIDVEMSFIEEEDIQNVIEAMIRRVFAETLSVDLPCPFPRLTYAEAMRRFGSDKPDMRFGMEIVDISDLAAQAEFRVFAETLVSGGVVRGLRAAGAGSSSRKDVDGLAAVAAPFGARGVSAIWVEEAGIRSPLAKFLAPEVVDAILTRMEAQPGDLLLLVADTESVAATALGALRSHLADRLKVERQGWSFLWVLDFPMFEWDAKETRYKAQHHPFTRPRTIDHTELTTRPAELGTYAYDLVLNGVELGSGSLRVSDPKMQEAIFQTLGLGEEEIRTKFGFLVEAMDYGVPPYGGIALGLDRLVMLMAGEDSIREVIAFPKTQSGSCPLTGAPSVVSNDQMKELRLKTI
ncbi:MAG: aspartate--tRNA ligase [Actinobacteria bacterium]|nr:aspartate--tRNA ligase [Actinomycetota bacterium]